MMNSSRSSRPAKRDIIVIDDDESAIEQPSSKSAKREEEPIPSPDVVNAQQELDKWKDRYNRAVRVAGEYLKRAEKAEERLDSKDGIKDGFNAEKKRADDLEIRLTALTRLEEANKRAQSNVNLELALENEALKTQMSDMKKEHENITVELESKNEELKMELEMRSEEFKRELDRWRKEYQERREEIEKKNEELKTEVENLRTEHQKKADDLESRNDELKTELDNMRTAHSKKMIDSRLNEVRLFRLKEEMERATIKVNELTHQNITLKSNECELQKRNEELTLKLGQYEAAMQPLLQLQMQQLPYVQQLLQQQQKQQAAAAPHSGEAPTATSNVASSGEVVELRKSGHSLADSDLSEKLLDLIRQARKHHQLTRGIEATENTLSLGTSELIIFASDVVHPYIRRDLPLLCENKNVPYVFVKSVEELSRVCGEGHPAVCSITRVVGSPIESTIAEIKKEVQKLFHPRD